MKTDSLFPSYLKPYIIGGVFGFLIIILAMGFWLSRIGSDCDYQVVAEYESPDQQFVATIFEGDCGATTNYSTSVTLRKFADPFRPKKDPRILTIEGKHWIVLKWVSANEIEIKLSGVAPEEIFQLENRLGDIVIRYPSQRRIN